MRKVEKNKTFGPQSEGPFGFLGGEAATFGLGRLGALRHADLFPDLGTPGGSGSAPSTKSTNT